MTRKGILFGIFMTIGFASIILIRPGSLFGNLSPANLRVLTLSLKAVVLTILYVIVIKKAGLMTFGGFLKHFKINYWMLLIPLLFPGIWAYKSFSFSCNDLPVIVLLFTTLLQGLWEEINFRGIIQGYLLKSAKKPSYHSIFLFTATLFALGHFINLRSQHPMNVINQVIYAFLTGLMFSAIQLHINNTWLLGIVHGLLNFFFKSCNPYPTPPEETTEPLFWDYVSQAALIFLIFSPMLIIYWLLMKKIKKPDRSSFN